MSPWDFNISPPGETIYIHTHVSFSNPTAFLLPFPSLCKVKETIFFKNTVVFHLSLSNTTDLVAGHSADPFTKRTDNCLLMITVYEALLHLMHSIVFFVPLDVYVQETTLGILYCVQSQKERRFYCVTSKT
jgi:hypothetical protein